MASLLIDIHTHLYPPSYLSLLKARKTVPYVHQPAGSSSPRLIILPSDDDPSIPQHQRGRPLDSSYSSLHLKLQFMKQHNIAASVVSLANPWLDFLPANEGAEAARMVNDEMVALGSSEKFKGKIFAFGTLPLSAPMDLIVQEIHRLQGLHKVIKGVILGTSGLGKGLDDEALDPIWHALEETGLLIFLHPHYGLPAEVFGPKLAASGHVLPLSMGFPMETTIAFTRMYLCGVFDRFPKLKMLLAHAGGTTPFLAGRVDSCVRHERAFLDKSGKLKQRRSIWEVLKENIWLDGVVYSEIGIRAAVDIVGSDRVLWGTDHPFFPPIESEETEQEWLSVKLNIEAVEKAQEPNSTSAKNILGLNAVTLLDLELPSEAYR